MNNIPFFLLAAIAGACLPLQAVINAQLRQVIGNPVLATFLSFVVGAILLAVYVFGVQRQTVSAQQLGTVSWWKWTGGAIGAIFVLSVILVVPQIGVANMTAILVASQLILALIFDHYGVLGSPIKYITWEKGAGAVLLILGAILIVKK